MLIIDDILTFPVRGLVWVFEEIKEAAEQELSHEADAITLELQQLYALFEGGKITEAEFDQREGQLLDRLDRVQESGSIIEDYEDDLQDESQ